MMLFLSYSFFVIATSALTRCFYANTFNTDVQTLASCATASTCFFLTAIIVYCKLNACDFSRNLVLCNSHCVISGSRGLARLDENTAINREITLNSPLHAKSRGPFHPGVIRVSFRGTRPH